MKNKLIQVPLSLFTRLEKMAKAHGRSTNKEIIEAIKKAVASDEL